MVRGWLLILVSVLLVWDFYRLYHSLALHRWLKTWHPPSQPAKPRVMKPKSELDCPECQAAKHFMDKAPPPHLPLPWALRKKRGRRKKHIPTQGYFCPNQEYPYYGIPDEQMHALVGDGVHGQHEPIQIFICQACHTKFTARRTPSSTA